MDDHELVSAIWELLLTSGAPLHADAIADTLGAEAAPVRSVLASFRQAALVAVDAGTPKTYIGRTSLDPLAWARAVDLGINIHLIERLAHLETKDRKMALQLATDGQVERVKESEAKDKQAIRTDRRLRKVKSQVAATELSQLVTDAKSSLLRERKKQSIDPLTKKALALLEQTIAEGQQALDSLQRHLLGN